MRIEQPSVPRRWVETVDPDDESQEGFVNLRFVAVIKWVREKRLYRLMTAEGTILGYCKEGDLGLELNVKIVPAHDQSVTIVQSEDGTFEGEDIWTGELPIVAWAVEAQGYARPIVPTESDKWSGECRMYLNLPDGRFGNDDGQIVGSRADLIAMAKAEVSDDRETYEMIRELKEKEAAAGETPEGVV